MVARKVLGGLLLTAGTVLLSSGVLPAISSAETVPAATPYVLGPSASVQNLPWTVPNPPNKGCDPDRDGWHFVMNGITASVAGNLLNANDFGAIDITFSDSTHGTALWQEMSGGGATAHFLGTADHQTGLVYPVSAVMAWPQGTRVTGYNNFVLSHPPCTFGSPTTTSTTTTTTTTAPTTTAPTTTTSTTTTTTTTAPTTTAPTTTTSTTNPQAPTTTTTVAPSSSASAPVVTTTTLVASQPGGVPTTTTTIVATSGALPSTGQASQTLVVLGIACLVLGGLTLLLGRRPSAS